MTGLFIIIGILSLISDGVALYFAFHSKRHEQENTTRLARIEELLGPENGQRV